MKINGRIAKAIKKATLLLTILAIVGIAIPAHAQVPLAQGTYATHFNNYETKTWGQLQSAEVGQVVFTPTSSTGGTVSWRSNGMFEDKFGEGICLGQFSGTYTEDSDGNLFLFQHGGTCIPVTCGGFNAKADCTEGIPIPNNHREWLYCLDEVKFIDCVQAAAYDAEGQPTATNPTPGWQIPAEQWRLDKLPPS